MPMTNGGRSLFVIIYQCIPLIFKRYHTLVIAYASMCNGMKSHPYRANIIHLRLVSEQFISVSEFLHTIVFANVLITHAQSWLLNKCSSTININYTTHVSSFHYCNVIIGEISSQITSLTIVDSTGYSDADQRKHLPHKWPVTRKTFPGDDVIM